MDEDYRKAVQEYNVAIANGLYMKARLINRRLLAMEKLVTA